LDTTKLTDGYHELRVVGSRSDSIETQGRRVVPIVVDNQGATLKFKVSPAARVPISTKLKLSVHQSGATTIAIRQNSRDVSRVTGESGEVEIPASLLGRGPSTLQAFSEGKVAAASLPLRIVVE
jgi:hypothetical protein